RLTRLGLRPGRARPKSRSSALSSAPHLHCFPSPLLSNSFAFLLHCFPISIVFYCPSSLFFSTALLLYPHRPVHQWRSSNFKNIRCRFHVRCIGKRSAVLALINIQLH